MATRYLQHGDLLAWITMEGSPREVFSVEKPRPNVITCWITSEAGKKFAVNWRNSLRQFALQGKVIIDGVTCDQHVMLDADGYPGRANSIGVSFARTSQYTQRDFMFSTIEVTDDDAYLDTVNKAYNFGTISLELWRLQVDNVTTKTLEHQNGRPVLESQMVHERSKKAGTHHTKYSEEYYAPPPVVDVVTSHPIGTEPVITFTFKYRPLAMLMAHGIIPRPLVSPPQSEVEEIRQLEARLKVLQARAGGSSSSKTRSPMKKARKEIKKEPGTHGWPRRSISRPPEIIDLTLD